MKSKSLILGFCATTIAATGAIAAFANNAFATFYVKVGTNIITISTGSTFPGCAGTGNTCRVKLIRPNGTVITEATTVYTNPAGTTSTLSSDALSGTVIIPN